MIGMERLGNPVNNAPGSIWRRPALTLGLLGVSLAAIACGSEGRPTSSGEPPAGIPATARVEPTPEIPDGWTRVQVRDGFLGRYAATPLVGFTIDLPPDWKAGESWARGDILEGWIAAPPNALVDWWPTFWYRIGADPQDEVQALKEDPRYEITELELNGVKVAVRVAASEATRGTQFGAYYEQIPGAPDRVTAPRLDIGVWVRGFDDPELLGQILRSVLYEAIPTLPDTPDPGMVAGTDWIRTIAGSDSEEINAISAGSFSLRLPPGWTTTERRGIDSTIGAISGDGIQLIYNNPMSLFDARDQAAVSGEAPEHVFWEELVDGLLLSLVRPVSPEPDDLGTTGVMIRPFIDGDDASAASMRLSVLATGLSGEQQEMALAILRTIQVVDTD